MSSVWKKRIAALIAILLALLMILPMLVMVIEASAVSQSDVDKLKNEAKNLEQEKKDIDAQLARLRESQATAMEEKLALDRQITIIEEQIATTALLIEGLDAEILQKEEEIAAAEQREAERYELFKQRIRAMEENDSASYLSVVLKAGSFSDMLARMEIIDDIMEYDRNVMDDLKRSREAVETAKAELEASRAEQQGIRESLEADEAELQLRLEEQANFILRLEADQQAYTKAYEEAQRELDKTKGEIDDMLKELEKLRSNSVYVGGTYLWPLPGHSNISSPFGMRYHPVLHKYSKHTGTDITAKTGTEIVAANSGEVVVAKYSYAYGNYVVIDHGGGQRTLYGHMSKMGVSKGQKVARGDVIGWVGSTGYSTGPHLHFEIIVNGTQIDPMTHFTKQ